MNRKITNTLLPLLIAVCGLLAIGWWQFSNPVSGFVESIPGMDQKPEGEMKAAAVVFGGYSEVFAGIPSDIVGDWPGFRGPDGDNISKEETKLANSWKESGPPLLWSVDLGEGHSGPIISNGKVYILDYNEEKRADMLRCFSLDNGTEIWRRGYEIFLKRNHGISRTVPAISDSHVVSMGPKCHLMCLDADTGALKWGIDLERDFGTEVPLWYTGQCPLIDDSRVIVGIAGSSLLSAFDLETGDVVWSIPNPNNWQMSHTSVITFMIGSEKCFLYCALGGVVGVSDSGDVLFESSLYNHSVVAPTPVYLGDGKVFLTAGYGAGSMTFKIDETDGTYVLRVIQEIKPNQGLASEQQTPIWYQGLLYSIQPKDAGSLRNQFVCYHPDDITKLVWSSGKTNRFGLGPYIVADNKFYILSDEGDLTMLDATANVFEELGSYKILEGHDAWGPMAIVKGRLLARDSKKMVCVDLRN